MNLSIQKRMVDIHNRTNCLYHDFRNTSSDKSHPKIRLLSRFNYCPIHPNLGFFNYKRTTKIKKEKEIKC